MVQYDVPVLEENSAEGRMYVVWNQEGQTFDQRKPIDFSFDQRKPIDFLFDRRKPIDFLFDRRKLIDFVSDPTDLIDYECDRRKVVGLDHEELPLSI